MPIIDAPILSSLQRYQALEVISSVVIQLFPIRTRLDWKVFRMNNAIDQLRGVVQ